MANARAAAKPFIAVETATIPAAAASAGGPTRSTVVDSDDITGFASVIASPTTPSPLSNAFPIPDAAVAMVSVPIDSITSATPRVMDVCMFAMDVATPPVAVRACCSKLVNVSVDTVSISIILSIS